MDAVLAKKMVGSVFGGESGALIAPKMENLWRHANSTRNGAIDGNRMGLSDFLEILHGLVQPADAFEEPNSILDFLEGIIQVQSDEHDLDKSSNTPT